MSETTYYKCDVCGKPITEGHQQLFMATVKADYTVHVDDGSAAGTEARSDTFHVHNDFSRHCLHKLWKVLVPKMGKGSDDKDTGSKQS